ncbi:hypothetical protein ABPG72_021994 [Tetrahymena utriculariae]
MSQDYSDEMEEVKKQFDKKVVRKVANEDDDEDEDTENFSNRKHSNILSNKSKKGRREQDISNEYELYDELGDLVSENADKNDNEEEDNNLNQDIDLIIKVITQEKYCPDIILYQQQIIDDLFELIQNQEMQIKEFEQSINDDKKFQHPKNKFLQDLMKEECDRVKYLIKLYTRTRLYKIQKYYMNIIKHSKYDYLNLQEKEFVKNYAALRQQIFQNHLLKTLPQSFRDIGIESEEQETNSQVQKQNFEKIQIDTPNQDKVVFVKFKQGGNYDIDREQVKIEEGEIIMVAYKHIKTLHQNLDVDLV